MKIKALHIIFLITLLEGRAAAQNGASSNIQRIKCHADTTNEYALYLPEKFDALLIILDPAARGDVPIRKYTLLADQYGIIMAGSYNSRNFDGNSSIESFVTIYNDITSRYNINPEKIWVSGFSGGARAAVSVGLIYPEVRGVIGCGAGFADENADVTKLSNYAGIAGMADMNFTELSDNSNYLDEKKVSNVLLTFNGGHIWPPVETYGLAVEWLLDRAHEPSLIATYRGGLFLNTIRHSFDSGFLYAACNDAKQIVKVSPYKKSADSLLEKIRSDKGFMKDSLVFMRAIYEEQTNINDFSIAFNKAINMGEAITNSHWEIRRETIDDMRRGNHYRKQSAERCFDHATRICQEYYYMFMNNMDYKKALKAATILSCFTPGKYNGYYLMACVHAMLNDKNECKKLLREAVKRGMVYSGRVVQSLQPALSEDEIIRIFEK